jgi:hypothetical protein
MESGFRQLTTQDITTLSTTKQEQFGAMGATPDGRIFRYAGFGGTSTIAPSQLLVAKAYTANYYGLAITAVGTGGQTTGNLLAGSTQLVLTNGATAITQDQFAEGYLEVIQTSGTNEGPVLYKIKGNTAAAATTGYVTVFLNQDEPLRNAETLVAGTDTASLNPSPYAAVAPSATAGQVAGVSVVQTPNSSTVTNYGWVQTQGSCILTNDAGGNLTVGEGIAQSTTTAGDIVAVAATTYQIGQTKKAFNASTAGPCTINLA